MKVYDEAFTNNNIYAASATSIAIAAAIFVLSYGLLRLSSRRVFEGR
jgi:multiple sugar transport system permease protein